MPGQAIYHEFQSLREKPLYLEANWAVVLSPRTAAKATLALNAAENTRRFLLAPQFPDHFQATVALFSGLVILIGAGVMMVNMRLQQAELQTREALLRLEYRIAELSEKRPPAS